MKHKWTRQKLTGSFIAYRLGNHAICRLGKGCYKEEGKGNVFPTLKEAKRFIESQEEVKHEKV